MSNLDSLHQGYVEAIYFTETGEADQPAKGAELTDWTKSQAYLQCRNFYWATTEALSLDLDWYQAGIDLWLTRNGHGTGFWDRGDLYGENTHVLTALAKAMGAVEAVFVDQL